MKNEAVSWQPLIQKSANSGSYVVFSCGDLGCSLWIDSAVEQAPFISVDLAQGSASLDWISPAMELDNVNVDLIQHLVRDLLLA